MSEPFVQYTSASKREPLPSGAVCAGCGFTLLLVRDHCHEHGWVRDIVCMRCNAYLGFIDQRITPGVDEALLAALLAVRNRCPDCERLDAASLKRRIRPEPTEPKPVSYSKKPAAYRERLRRTAERRGHKLVKSSSRDPLDADFGTYWLIPAEGHPVGPLTLGDVEERLASSRRRD